MRRFYTDVFKIFFTIFIVVLSANAFAGSRSGGGGYSSRSYSSPSRSYSSPSYSRPSAPASSGKPYSSTPYTYRAPVTTQPYRSGVPARSPYYGRNPIVEHHYYDHGGFGGSMGNMWFWMWAMDQGHNQQPVYVNGVPQQGQVAGGTTIVEAQQGGMDRFLTILLHLFISVILLTALGYLIYWVVQTFRIRHY